MTTRRGPVFALMLGAVLAWGCASQPPAGETPAGAQSQAADVHVAAARAAAASDSDLHDFTGSFKAMCVRSEPGTQGLPTASEPADFDARPIPTRAEGYIEPVKVFDNLYKVGSRDHVWAVTTSEGIILLNSGKDYTTEWVLEGLTKMGLNPADVKYVVILMPHDLHYGAAKLFQDRYGARVLLSEKDWDIIERTEYVPDRLKPRKDMVVSDGQQLTLGGTTLTLYITPGHGPGSLSVLVPLQDGDRRHLGALIGGRNWNYLEEGLLYFSSEEEAIEAWRDSTARFRDVAAKAGADVLLLTRPHDNTEGKLRALMDRTPGVPHPYVDRDAVTRYLTVMNECLNAELTWRTETDSVGASR